MAICAALELEAAAFDGAFCFGNSFGYLDHTGVAAFLSALAGALKPGAQLVIETGMCAESILPTLVQKRWHRFGDLMILSENRYDPWESCLHIDYTFVREQETIETRPTAIYVFTSAELRQMLERRGSNVLAFHGERGGRAVSARLAPACDHRRSA